MYSLCIISYYSYSSRVVPAPTNNSSYIGRVISFYFVFVFVFVLGILFVFLYFTVCSCLLVG